MKGMSNTNMNKNIDKDTSLFYLLYGIEPYKDYKYKFKGPDNAAIRVLIRNKKTTIQDICEMTSEEFLRIKNFGKYGLSVIYNFLLELQRDYKINSVLVRQHYIKQNFKKQDIVNLPVTIYTTDNNIFINNFKTQNNKYPFSGCTIDKRNYEILFDKLNNKSSYRVLASKYNITHERVRQICLRTLYKLKLQYLLNNYNTELEGINARS